MESLADIGYVYGDTFRRPCGTNLKWGVRIPDTGVSGGVVKRESVLKGRWKCP